MNNYSNKKSPLIILGVLLIIGLGGYIIYDKFIDKEIGNNNNENKVENNNKQEVFVSKINEDSNWVYDKTYDYKVYKNGNSNYNNGDGYKAIKEIVVPFINIDTQEAKKANKEFEKLFYEAVDIYNLGAEEYEENLIINEETPNYWVVRDFDYIEYINNDIISVNFVYSYSSTFVPKLKYVTYNFDLKTGELVSYEDIYTSLDYKSTTLNQKVEETIANTIKEYLGYDKDPDEKDEDGYSINDYIKQSVQNYHKAVQDNSIQYFIDRNKNLNIVVTLIVPIESGEINEMIVLK